MAVTTYLISYLKSNLLVQLALGYVFVVSGLIVNLLMLCSCVIWPFSRHLYRKIIVYLAYSHWSQVPFLAQWWSGSNVILYMKPEDLKYLGKEHTLAILNHKYDIDWVMTWLLCEEFGCLGSSKVVGKKSLRYVPLIGWAWYFTETIFLNRKWEHDKYSISRDLQKTYDFPKGYYVTLLLFPEGTRFTEKKHQASLEVSRAKGYPELKHLLLPRPKGFALITHGLKGHFQSVLNCTVGFETNGIAPTFMNIFNGKPIVGHFHIERIPLEDVPSETEEESAAYLRDLFKKKDDLFEDFLQTGKFAGPSYHFPRRVNNLLMFLFWAVLLWVPLAYYIISLFVAGTITQQLIVVAAVAAGAYIVKLMIGVTEIEKGSGYGTEVLKNGLKKSQ
ncbi:1-acyl-sn-glycerol-3-phosphate acyltransferase 3 [Elysia marginata]|uniref:1-acyl-sn-glycerol-3-phosphate acyltransferase 3 n=1 Tax=Elysia marginata TaxID=1093978 RepID=A0AAV4F361_9GAST|nr:1-acyl-sn-glycerol-3-phosphate acyltransferase 3 [Elysia marginata]